jgi:hypothetical protein
MPDLESRLLVDQGESSLQYETEEYFIHTSHPGTEIKYIYSEEFL